MPSNEIPNLGEFFSLIGDERKKKQDEFDSLVGDLSGILSELDKASQQTKKKEEEKKKETSKKEEKKKKIKEPEVSVDVDSLFAGFASIKKQAKEKKEKEIKEAKAFENWLFSEPKVEEITSVSPIIGEDTTKYEEWIEEEVAEREEESMTHEEMLEVAEEREKENEEKENEEEEVVVDESVSKAAEILEKLIPEEERLTEEDDEIGAMKREIAQLRKMVYQSIQSAAAQGGGGEVRLEFLDDVDRDSTKVDNKFLRYNSSTGKWEGADAGGIASLGPLADVAGLSTTAIDDGAVLEFNASTGQFIATSKSSAGISTVTVLTDLSDVVGTATTNDVLIFNGTDYTFETPFYVVDLSDGVQDGALDVGIYT